MEDWTMVKFLNRHSFLLFLLLITSFISYGFWGCDSGGGGGGNNKTRINGTVLQVIDGPVSDIRVSIFENNRRKQSTRTNQFGEFNLRFTPDFNTVRIEFEGPDYTLSRIISVTRDSDVELDVILQISPGAIFVENWVVFQNRIRASGFDEIIFDSLEADFNIDGNGNDCISAKGDSRIEIAARNISLIDCKEGIRAENFGFVLLEADEDISVSANRDGIRTNNNTFVRLARTVTPVDNNIFVTSLRENGIRASGSSAVEIDPQNECTISGAKLAVDQSGTSNVNPSTCTLIDG
jgi:hypothetical protein